MDFLIISLSKIKTPKLGAKTIVKYQGKINHMKSFFQHLKYSQKWRMIYIEKIFMEVLLLYGKTENVYDVQFVDL